MSKRLWVAACALCTSCCSNDEVAYDLAELCPYFFVDEVQVETPSTVDGTKFEGVRDIYVTFSASAKEVYFEIFDAAPGLLIMTYSYPEYLYQPNQTVFAMTVAELEPSRTYVFTVEGYQPSTGCTASYADNFRTTNF